jgi:hypothetical protein
MGDVNPRRQFCKWCHQPVVVFDDELVHREYLTARCVDSLGNRRSAELLPGVGQTRQLV